MGKHRDDDKAIDAWRKLDSGVQARAIVALAGAPLEADDPAEACDAAIEALAALSADPERVRAEMLRLRSEDSAVELVERGVRGGDC